MRLTSCTFSNADARNAALAPLRRDGYTEAMKTLTANCIYSNVALTDDGDVWWEQIGYTPEHTVDWMRRSWIVLSRTFPKSAMRSGMFC